MISLESKDIIFNLTKIIINIILKIYYLEKK